MIRAAVPVLHIRDSATAEAFYCGGLGFSLRFAYRPDESINDPCYLIVMRDGVVLHLSSFSGDAVVGGVCNLLIDDVDAMHAELSGRGVTIALAPTDQAWGIREMYVKDADGNSVRFQQVP